MCAADALVASFVILRSCLPYELTRSLVKGVEASWEFLLSQSSSSRARFTASLYSGICCRRILVAMWLLCLHQTEFSVLSTRERDAADWIVVHDVKMFKNSSLESERSPTIVCVCACRELRMSSFFGPVTG